MRIAVALVVLRAHDVECRWIKVACGHWTSASVQGGKVGIELPADLQGLFVREAVAGRKFRDRLEVVVLSARQAPVEHPRRRVSDVLEPVHYVPRDEHDRAGAGRRRPTIDGQLVETLEN